ncbi:DMT family transporter [Marinilabiliaceae bacterium JC017]|nr:DMT family transporter [Marinilabiliaceae bacterium JC017]
MWFLFALGSALFLGVYDVFKKLSVNDNAVLPVLFFSTLTSALLFIPLLVGSYFELIPTNHLLYIPPITMKEHLLISLKAAIVLISWIFSFFALKHLPITIVSPIRATGPLWTLIGAIILYGEKLSMLQWSGMAITLCFFFLFSTAGKREGISFTKNKWVWFIILGTLAGTASGLYDKFLIREIHRMAVQSYFSIYQVVLMTPIIFLLWWPNRQRLTPFKWRFTIPLIGLFLVIADFFYFYALSYPDSMISIISALRRGSVIIAFSFGAFLFKERHIAMKALYLAGIMLGILFLVFGSR